MASDGFADDATVDDVMFGTGAETVTSYDLLLMEHYVNDPAGLFEIPDDVRYFLDYVL